MSSERHPFKAIIVGGGPVGLAAAHALHLAGIDFLVLESRPVLVEDKGASLITYPHTLRVLHQFGVLDKLLPHGTEVRHHLSFTSQGHVFKEGNQWAHIRENHGYGPVAFHRAELIDIMYQCLPPAAREKVLTDKKLIDIKMEAEGVKVACADGSSFEGSIVIGADGVHSKTRQLMRTLALKADPIQSWDSEEPYTATYQLLYGSFPSPSAPGLGYDIQAKDKSIAYFSSPDRGWFFLYKRLPKPTKERTTYTDKEINSLAQEFFEFPLTRSVKVKDVWPRMSAAGLTNLEEGIVQHWSLGRIVLVGDACHKMTTHLGLGFNNGIQDVVVLCNSLRMAVNASSNGIPSASALTETFEKYHEVRMSSDCSLKGDVWRSGFETRMHTWQNIWFYILSRYLVLPHWTEGLLMRHVFAPEFRKGRVLDYVSKEEPMKGMMSWLYPMKT